MPCLSADALVAVVVVLMLALHMDVDLGHYIWFLVAVCVVCSLGLSFAIFHGVHFCPI